MEKGKLQKEGLSNWNTKNYGEVTEREARERNCKTACNWNSCVCLFAVFFVSFSQKGWKSWYTEGFPLRARAGASLHNYHADVHHRFSDQSHIIWSSISTQDFSYFLSQEKQSAHLLNCWSSFGHKLSLVLTAEQMRWDQHSAVHAKRRKRPHCVGTKSF